MIMISHNSYTCNNYKVAVQEDTSKIVARNTVEHTTDSLLSKQDEKPKEKKDNLSKGVKL